MIDNEIRLLAVERFKTLNIDEDIEFQELIHIASETCNTPIAMLTLIDGDTQWLKVRQGTDVTEIPREYTFCTYTIQEDNVLVVPDATLDERFANYPTVANDPNVRFYAGAPLITSDGHKVGSICVIDLEPHELTKQQQLMLKMLSKQAINIMEYRISVELLGKNIREVELHKEVIKKAEIRLRSFFESSPNFQVLLGKNGEVIDFNKVAYTFIKKMYGLKLTRGSLFTSFIAPDFVAKFNKGYRRALRGEKTFMESSTDLGVEGIIYWEASFETARDSNNDIVGISYVIRDVTDRKIKEIKIIDQNKSLLKIAHFQAHEFRAPLTTVIALLDLIKEDDYDVSVEYYEKFRSATENLDQKIHEIVNDVNNITLLNNTEVYSI